MKIKFLLIFTVSLMAVILIGVYAEGWFWRGFLSDVTVVVLLFSFFQMIMLRPTWTVALTVLSLSFFIEFAQYYHLVDVLGIKNKLIRTLIGNHFDWLDLLAYIIGFFICLMIGRGHQKNVGKFNVVR